MRKAFPRVVEWSLGEVPTLEVFRTRMETALDSLVQRKVSLPMSGLELDGLPGPF